MKPQEYAARSTRRGEWIPVRTTTTRQYRETQVDVKLVLCALWIAMMLVFAYVDIFTFFRADVLNAALDGKVATMDFTVNQTVLTAFLIYILPAVLMVVLSLLLTPRVNRILNIVVSLVYLVSIIGGCIGETWAYYFLGSAIEVVLLAAIARTAWKWPPPQIAPSLIATGWRHRAAPGSPSPDAAGFGGSEQ